MDFDSITHLTFDCYGTLIDWETGILGAVSPVLGRHGRVVEEERILQSYAVHEAQEEKGPYRTYRVVLERVMAGLASDFGCDPSAEELRALPESVGRWPPFPDTVESLQRLKSRFQLAILSNVDDDMFEQTARLLGVEFDHVITAEQVGSYKPARQNFHRALERIGAPVQSVLHVAQSLYHDHAPALELGFRTVWVNRPSRRPGTGVAPPAAAAPDLEVGDLKSLVDRMGL